MSRTMPLTRFLAAVTGRDAAPGASTDTVPALGTLPADAAAFSSVRFRVSADYMVRELRGSKMRTVAGVFDEFAAAFQFPYYFGENKDAFDECLRDLDEFVGPALGYVALVRDSSELLADQPGEREWFTSAIDDCARNWSARGVLFRVIMQGDWPGSDAVALTL
ncbi:barstar family protein [Nocardia alni]|uniref:barstar family protein n=1 Tax=Nocardia alni TaxID=2815723 RepID=UPI001C22E4A2|nr:barstar family protein [Nocardia alni]